MVLRLPRCPKEATVKCSKARYGNKNGDHRSQPLKSTVGKCLQRHKQQIRPTVTYHIYSSFSFFFLMIHKARNRTDHSHSIWQKHLSGSHHGVVGHINKHIKDCHCHNGQDYCQWHVSDKAGYTQRDITAGGNLVFKKTTDYSRCFMLKYLLGFVTSSVIKFKLNLEEKRKPRLRHKALIVSYSTYIVM